MARNMLYMYMTIQGKQDRAVAPDITFTVPTHFALAVQIKTPGATAASEVWVGTALLLLPLL